MQLVILDTFQCISVELAVYRANTVHVYRDSHALVIMIACQYIRTKVVLRIPLGVRIQYTFRLIITIIF